MGARGKMADKKPERKQECVQVVVRCRPFSKKETKENRGNIIAMETALFQARTYEIWCTYSSVDKV